MHAFSVESALERIRRRAHHVDAAWTASPQKKNLWSRSIAAVAGALALSVGAQSMAQTVVTLAPTADSYIQQGTPTTNYGTATTMLVRIDTANSLSRAAYLQFNLASLPAGTITSAQLRVYGSHDTGGTGVSINAYPGTVTATWSETALNWNNALASVGVDFNGTPLGTTAVSTTAAYYSWNVTSLINSRRSVGNATVALYPAAADTYRVTFNSKEAAANRPELVVTVDTGSSGGATLAPIGDTYTQQGTPTTNYGTQTTVLVRKDAANTLTRGGYFEFDLSSLPAGTVTSAKLQLFGSQDTGGTGVTINAFGGTATAAWSETALIYNNGLALSGVDFSGTPITSTAVSPPPSKTYEWDVTSYIASRRSGGNNIATIGLGYVAADTYRSTFNSKEAAANKPQLVVVVSGGGDTTAPTPPNTLTATAASATQINLSWTASTDNVGVTGYRVERCQGASCTTFAQIATPTATSYSDTGLTASTSYSYRVRATDAAGNLSSYSSTASATTQSSADTVAPTAPGSLTATATSATQINLSWTASTDNVGVTGYQVERCQGASCTTFAQIATPTATSYSDTGLTASTSYSYRVRATDAAGNLSSYSNTASATTPTGGDTTPPSAPTGLTATAAGSSQINLTWTAATDNVGVTGYRVERCPAASCNNQTSFTEIAAPTGTSYNDTGLNPGSTYTYRVRASDGAGNLGTFSATAAATTATVTSQLPGTCPAGFPSTLITGGQTSAGQPNIMSFGGVNRGFTVNIPADTSTPRPVWVPLTGSVESTNENLDTRGGNRVMTSEGFIVIGPVRKCAGTSPTAAGTSANGGTCNQAGTGGWNWNPWNEGRVFGAAGDPWKTDEGDDSRFLEAVVRCVANFYPVDANRIYVGGISSGGTMTNRALTFNSDFWAGGEPISGEWYMTQDNGNAFPGSNEFSARVAAVAANPTKIFQGRVGPYPLYNTQGNATQLSPMIVITLWGGSTDNWSCDGGATLCADYRPTTQSASNYFTAQPNVVHVACSSHHGHQWPTFQRDAWNRWVLRTLASHPKGTPASAFVLPSLGALSTDYSCKVGVYTDHYTTGGGGTLNGENWSMFGHDLSNTRSSSTETAISPSNVSTLHVLWRNGTTALAAGPNGGNDGAVGGVPGTPSIVDGVAYVSDFNGWVRAINAADGVEKWKRQVTPTGSTLRQTTPSIFVDKATNTVYTGGNIGMVYALNMTDGTLRWSRQIETTPNSRVSSSPIVVPNAAGTGSIVIVGAGSYQVWLAATPMFRGSVKYLDAATGALLNYTTNMCPSGTCGGGITVWSTAAVDLATRTGFIGTGQAYAAPAGPYSDALVAFDIDTGAIKWSGQFHANDVWSQGQNITGKDQDVGAAPNLFSANIPNVGVRDVVGVGSKGGLYKVYDRNTGQLYWTHTLGPGSPLGGMMYAAAYSNGVIYAVSNDLNQGSGANGATPRPARARAVNANDGSLIWSTPLTEGGYGGVTVANGLMYFTTWNGILHVLNTATGAEVKTVTIGTAVGVYQQSGSLDGFVNGSASGPVVYGGRVFVGYGMTWVLNIPGGLASLGL